MISDTPPPFREHPPAILILDVDGVLTSNRILLDGEGREWKPFFIPDGAGIKWLQGAGVEVVLVSGRPSPVVARRASELGISHHLDGVHDKAPAVQALLRELDIAAEAAVYVGDDLIDLPPMRAAGLPVAVANAHPQVCRAAVAVTTREGGSGAVREVCEWILAARGEWTRIVERYAQ